jgi:tRNA 5-methylaminomethyl-2-thiouridine biosynthesis bifunctional protein
MPIQTAKMHFDDSGTPVCETYGDFYYSTDDGLRESQYVFIQGNQLPERWLEETQSSFVIGETGFGTGLNFLATWLAFRAATKAPTQLHFISFEKYPLSTSDLNRSLANWPELDELSKLLINQYPNLLPGCHRLVFDQGKVILDLWMGDIKDTLPQLFHGQSGFVDAWYLDGFAPNKNSDIWSNEVFQSIRALTKLNGTLATFTSARVVRNGLTEAGFTLAKITGFGKKRKMLTGQLIDKPQPVLIPPFYFRHPNTAKKQVAIIGGGIASAQLCYSLAKRDYDITLFCKDESLAQGASQNRQGALYPLLHADDSSLSEFYAHAYMFAVKEYKQVLTQGFDFNHQFCGVLLQAYNDKIALRQQTLSDCKLWPSHLFTPMDAKQCSETANIALPDAGLYFPDGGWIDPRSLIDALIEASKQLTTVNLKFEEKITKLEQHNNGDWQIGQSTFANVVICSGHLTNQFEQTKSLGLSSIRGQVSHLDAIDETDKLSTVLCYNGYITPALKGQHSIGASFIKGDSNTEIRDKEHHRNLERLQDGIGAPPWFDKLSVPTQGRASIRCASIDHLPMVGAVPNHQRYQQTYQYLWKGLKPQRYDFPPDYDNLFILTALGARGLCSAPLAAEILAAQMNNEPYPVSNRVLGALNPGRGFIKALRAKN